MRRQLFILIVAIIALTNITFANETNRDFSKLKNVENSFANIDAYLAKTKQDFGNDEEFIKFFNQERIRLSESFENKLWKYLSNTAKKVSLKVQEIELEKILREAVKESEYIYVAKVQSSTVVWTGKTFRGRHNDTVKEHTTRNRMLVEKNLKGKTKKLINLDEYNFRFKKGAKYLIFTNTRGHLIKAVKLNVASEELELVERILSENK